MILNRSQLYGIFFIFSILIFFVSKDFGMFWDNVLFASRMGSHLYENGLFSWMMPDAFDPGHPPFLGFVLAIGWTIFGQSIEVSHAMLIPFTFGVMVQLFRLCEYYLDRPEYIFLVFLLLIFDPTLDAQFILVSPEVIQLFFFFLALNAYLRQQKAIQIIAMAFLGIVSYRGMMMCGGLFLFEVIDQWLISENKKFRWLSILQKYSIAAIPALVYLSARLYFKGWIYTHPNSPWFEYSTTVDITGLLRNIVVLGHRYLDSGRVFIFIALALLLFRKNNLKDIKNRQLLIAAMASCIIIIIASVRVTNPMGHRYFIASYLLFALLAGRMLLSSSITYKKWMTGTLIVGMLTGNLWIYPPHIAQGWDASLACAPYFELRKNAIAYLDEHHIPIESTGTFSPNATDIHSIDLNGDHRKFPGFNGKQPYVLYANVFNLNDDELAALYLHYTSTRKFSNRRIHVHIFKRR